MPATGHRAASWLRSAPSRPRSAGRPRRRTGPPAASVRRRWRSPRGSAWPAPRCAAGSRRRRSGRAPAGDHDSDPVTAVQPSGAEAAGDPAPDDVLWGPPLQPVGCRHRCRRRSRPARGRPTASSRSRMAMCALSLRPSIWIPMSFHLAR